MKKNNLKSIFNQLKVNAEWFGIRKVYESNTYRMIRDGNPQANSTGISHGIMVEVLNCQNMEQYNENKYYYLYEKKG